MALNEFSIKGDIYLSICCIGIQSSSHYHIICSNEGDHEVKEGRSPTVFPL
jgi:hypothetical protein